MLTVHRQPDRQRVYRRLHPFWRDKQLNCLCVFDRDLISAIFRSDKFRVMPYAESYRDITARTSIDFVSIIAALDQIPLANEGETHRKLRAEFASVMAGQGRRAVKPMEDYVTALAQGTFTAGSEVDLTGFAQQIYNHLFSLWLGTEQDSIVGDQDFSQVFDRTRSLNRRKKLNQNLAKLIEAFAGKRDVLSTSPEIAVAMNVVGKDAFIGSIVLSLWETLVRSPGMRLRDLAFPQSLPSTGVPYIERLALDDVVIGEMSVKRGERIRLFLDATALHVSGEETNLLFGAGRHLCLGKPMSLVIWRALTAAAGRISARYTPIDLRMREGDYVFSYPERAVVAFHE